jgi:predicted transcriptional regulator
MQQTEPLKCLKIKHEFAEKIFSENPEERKDWEIRLRKTKIRGRIAIGDTSTKKVIGYVTLFNCVQYSVGRLLIEGFERRHRAGKFIADYAKGREHVFAYCLEKPKRESHPYPYSFSTGSWCKALPPMGDEWR